MTRVSHIHWHSFSNAQVIQYVSNFTATVLYGNEHTDLVRCYSLLPWRCQICGVVRDFSILHFSGLQWKTTRVKGRKMTFIRNFLTTGTLVSSTKTMSFHWWRVSISLSRSYSDMVELCFFLSNILKLCAVKTCSFDIVAISQHLGKYQNHVFLLVSIPLQSISSIIFDKWRN